LDITARVNHTAAPKIPQAPVTTTRFDDKREAILDGAARLFNEHGLRGGMLSDVARSVGLATNSLTYYYRKKEDLVVACLQRAFDAMTSVADAAAQAPTLEARVHGYFGGYLGLLAAIAEGRHPQLVVFSDLLSLAPPHAAAMHTAYGQMYRRVRRLLDAPDAPALDAATRNARAHLLMSAASWARAWIARVEPADYGRVAGRMSDILVRGLAAPGRAPASLAVSLDAAENATSGGSATRAAFLRVATRLVNEHGYHGASVDRIAAELQAGRIPLVGRTEAEVSADLSARILAEGHQKVNFAIVAAGPNAASPHHHAG